MWTATDRHARPASHDAEVQASSLFSMRQSADRENEKGNVMATARKKSTTPSKPRERKKPERKVTIAIEFKGRYIDRYSNSEASFTSEVSGGNITIQKANRNEKYRFRLSDVEEVLKLATQPVDIVPKEG
jgi:hypothetical protein